MTNPARADGPPATDVHEVWVQLDDDDPASVRKARIHGHLLTTATNPGQGSPDKYGGRGLAAYLAAFPGRSEPTIVVLDIKHRYHCLDEPEELCQYFWGADLAEAYDALGEPVWNIGGLVEARDS